MSTSRRAVYFFYERGETSTHAPMVASFALAIIRGNKAGSAGASQSITGEARIQACFRKSLGGALLRRQTASSLLGPLGKQDARACPRCKPIEAGKCLSCWQRSSGSAAFDTIYAVRNAAHALVIATLAACPTCGASRSWLGLHARSPEARSSGLWNSQFVGARP